MMAFSQAVLQVNLKKINPPLHGELVAQLLRQLGDQQLSWIVVADRLQNLKRDGSLAWRDQVMRPDVLALLAHNQPDLDAKRITDLGA